MLLQKQDTLFHTPTFPQTRYQGSKYKLLPWLREEIGRLDFDSAIDGFSGTSAVGYMMKHMGKRVQCNDIMLCNYHVANALVKNGCDIITEQDYLDILKKHSGRVYKTFITDTFRDVYYLDYENEWLDIVVQNIFALKNDTKKSMFFWALYQACISKRPYNLFHRKNLHIRTRDVVRSFGNKSTWDTPFEVHFKKFITQANDAVFCNGHPHTVSCCDIKNIIEKADLIYLDPPYIPVCGSLTLYGDFYHFLNGLSDYDTWENRIDYKTKNLKLKLEKSSWEDKNKISQEFFSIIENNQDKKIVISYRKDGIPSIPELVNTLQKIGKKVKICEQKYSYVLSKNKTIQEVLIIGE